MAMTSLPRLVCRLSLLTVGALAVAAGGGCAAPSEEGGQDLAEIQGGDDDAAGEFAAVGFIQLGVTGDPSDFCTGFLVAPTTVVTAAHCLQKPVEGFYTGRGGGRENPRANMVKHRVVSAIAHPSYHYSEACTDEELDVAILKLADPILDTPLALGWNAPAVGDSCVATGFGDHHNGLFGYHGQMSWGVRRKGRADVAAVSSFKVSLKPAAASDALLRPGLPDSGDSGGPLVCGNAVVGVFSCTAPLLTFTRLDRTRAFIEAHL